MKTFTLMVVSFFITTLSFANISLNEKEALIALYKATNGSQWNSTWNLEAPVNSWYGVKVENDKIVEINLQFNNLQGTLPQEIGNLIYLRKMNLGFNKLAGTLPSSIKNL